MSHQVPHRGRVPPGIEDASEAAWRDYAACCAALDERLDRLRAAAAVQTRQLIRRASGGRAPLSPAITVDHVLRLARAHGRVCPMPDPWRCLHLLLPADAPAPIPARAWDRTSDFDKQRRLRQQIEWAARNGALTRLHDCLSALREQDWHRLPTLQWPALGASPPRG